MTLCYKRGVKNDFAYVLQFFSLISDSLGSVIVTVHKQCSLTGDPELGLVKALY